MIGMPGPGRAIPPRPAIDINFSERVGAIFVIPSHVIRRSVLRVQPACNSLLRIQLVLPTISQNGRTDCRAGTGSASIQTGDFVCIVPGYPTANTKS
jgi:hypothetical protein